MSKALIVYGYYDEADHYGELLDAVKTQLRNSGIDQIDVVNTFSFTKNHLNNNTQDLAAPTAEWFRGHRTKENEALIKAEQDKILDSTHIVFLYPIWWESLPHYMLTWVSEVFRSVSFRVGKGGEIDPQWIGDRKVMIITTAGFNQDVRREYFEKLLTQNGLSLLKEKSNTKIERFMNLSQTYPLMTALNYSGLKFSDQLHLCGVSKGNEPHVLAAAREGIKAFLKPVQVDQLEQNKQEDFTSSLHAPKTLLLSKGPTKDTSEPIVQHTAANQQDEKNTKATHAKLHM